jgi:TPR repeat protein
LREIAIEPLKRVVALVVGTTPPPAAAGTPPAAAITPKLVVEGADAGPRDEISLGVRLNGAAEGALVFVSGLAAGTALSTGRPWGETGWIVNAADVEKTSLRPPPGFSGTMQYTLTLRLADGRSVDRQTLRLQWDAAAANSGTPGREAAVRQISSEEIAMLLKRGEELFKTGDLAGARLLLQRAAEAHDPVGALALATTYDPNVLRELGVLGVAGDPTKARAWYEKAKDYGSREAPRRLELLASQGR